MSNSSSNTDHPKVSVVTITYNQDKYIRQFLDGFVMQKTDFDFEVIVADDHSTDKTQDIIREYADEYPDIFKPILRTKNIGADRNFADALNLANGTYLAICEGDDYWTDPQKLQLQVKFLDEHPDYALCFHPVKVIFEGSDKDSYVYPEAVGKDFDLGRLIKNNFIQTNSVMYRRQSSYRKVPVDITPGDWYLHLYHAKQGKIGFIDKVMSVYRRHPGGMWWHSQDDTQKVWVKHGLAHTRLFVEIKKLFKGNEAYQKIIDQSLYNMLGNLAVTDNQQGTDLFVQAEKEFPEFIKPLIVDRQTKVTELTKANKQLSAETEHYKREVTKLQRQLADIKNSKVWKVRNNAARVFKKEVI